jgi:hypothetical protein
MEVTYATRAASAAATNEDFVIAGGSFVVLLDGASAPPGVHSGCIHDVAWLVAQLGTHLAALLATRREWELREILRAGIERTRQSHEKTCDLGNRDSPSSTAVLLRVRGDDLEYAVLGDSGVVLEHADGAVLSVVDNRTSHLRRYNGEAVSSLRNVDGGFWVASIHPGAADRARYGVAPVGTVRRAGVFSDGVSRLTERYGWSWPAFLERLAEVGPGALIDAVRLEDVRVPRGLHPGKWPHDDATVVLVDFGAEPG